MEIKRIDNTEHHLVVDLFNKYRIFYNQSSDIDLADSFIKQRLEQNESVIFVALVQEDRKNIPAGFTQLYPKYSSVRAVKDWILNDLYVDASYRKKGLGEKLIKAAVEFANNNKAKFIQLQTAVDNYPAQSLYESLGFIKLEPESNFITYQLALNKSM
jgi:ribosomal protein S18 acetylase RimI-like enzyme